MKKAIKIIGICILVFVLLLISLPFLFKGKLIELVKKEANEMLNAKMDFGNSGFDFFRNFPHATISLNDFYIVGTGDFQGDTLIFAKKIQATVNVKSFFGGSGYEISEILVEGAKLHAIVTKDGKMNWDIVKPDNEKDAQSDSSPSDFKMTLKSVRINGSDIVYDDKSMNLGLAIKKLNLNLSGDMTADQTLIKTDFVSESLDFVMDDIHYLSNIKASATIQLNADFKNSKYTFSNNTFKLNEIEGGLDGWFAIPDEEKMEMDIRLNAPKTQFKDILSLIPAIYSNDFKDVTASGEVVFDAYMKGIMQGDTLPSFDVKMDISNAKFKYSSLPQSLDKITLKTRITNPGGSADLTIVDVPVFHFELAGNPFDMNLHLKTPLSDPDFSLSAIGHLNLGMVKEVYPLKDMELNGTLDANMKVAAKMSAINNGRYDQVNATGNLHLKNMVFKGIMKDDVLIDKASLAFSPRYLDLSDSKIIIGKNDLSAAGKLENFLPYALKNETLKGSLTLNSNYLNLNDFMTENAGGTTSTSTSTSKGDTVSTGSFVIPKNLDFVLSGNFKAVKFENLDMTDVTGQITVKEGKVDLKNVKMNALGGSMVANGYYDTGNNPQKPEVSIDLDIKNASFAKTFATFEAVKKFAPIFEAVTGNFSTSFKMKSLLGADFMPILTDLDAQGLLQSNSVEVENTEVMNLIASTLKNDALKDLKIKDLKLPFSISDGRVTTKPFDVNFTGGKMNLSGSTGLDQSIDYVAKIDLPQNLTKGYANKVNLKIGGTFTKPKISLDAADLANQVINKLAGSVLGGNDSTTVTEKVNAEVGKQADEIRRQAKEASDKLISEARKQGENLVSEAQKTKNPLAKAATVAAAQAAAKRINEEAEKQSKNIYAEAEKQINSLESGAKSQIK